MKLPCLLFSLSVSVVVALAADPLTEAFQRGLLAEESQRDLKAAAAAYDEVVRQADSQRELVATALFRRAEVRRRMGQTNEAEADYRRLLRQFSEQTNLASLAASRVPDSHPVRVGNLILEAELAQANQQLAQLSHEQVGLAAFVQRTRVLGLNESLMELIGSHPTDELRRLQEEWNRGKVIRAGMNPDFGPQHPEVTRATAMLKQIEEQLVLEVQSILKSLEGRAGNLTDAVESQRRQVRVLEAKLAQEQADADAAGSANSRRSASEQMFKEEIKLAEAQVAEIQRQVTNGKATQTELLKVQRDVLALKLQLARSRQPDLVDVVPGAGGETVAEADEESREIERLRRMLANSPDLINAPQGETKETPLQTAARLDQARVVEFLLAQKADLNAPVSGLPIPLGGHTPLHLAAKAGHRRMVELLLKAGAKVDAQAGDGQTPLHLAVASGHRQVVQALLAAGANLTLKTKSGPNILTDHGQVAQVTPLGLAVMCRSGALIEQLAEAGANLDEPAGATSPQVGPVSPLMLACLSHDFVTAGKVLELGANPGSDVKGRVPLSLAIGLGAPLGFMEQLVKQGAPLAWTGDEGETLLHLAVRSEHEGAVAWLLKRGLNPDSQDAEGNSVLLVAVNRVVERRGRGWSPTDKPSGAQAVVDLLMQAKANPNLANREGITPLWQAATSGQVELTQRLLTAGGNPNQSRPGHGPVAFAVLDAALNLPRQGVRAARSPAESAEVSRSGHSILQALLEAGADPNLPGRNGYRLLNFAISAGPQWVQVLLKHRADPNQRSPDDGATPLETIQSSRQLAGSPDLALTVESLQECERLLRAAGARDEVPNFRVIRVARKSSGFSQVVFQSGGTNDPNRFTLLELLAVHHGAMSAPPAFRAEPVRPEQPAALPGSVAGAFASRIVRGMPDPGLGFTDWRRVVIYRPAASGLERKELPVDVEALVAAGDCGRDVPLEWGDVVELPEREHAVDAPAEGRPLRIESLWQTCLTRTVNVSVKGESRAVKLAWGGDSSPGRPKPLPNPFTLEAALRQPGLLRTSSDVRRLQVERAGPEGTRTWLLDGSDGLVNAGFVLRGGDVIVVPDLPAGGK